MKVGSFLSVFNTKKQERVLGILKGDVGRGPTRGRPGKRTPWNMDLIPLQGACPLLMPVIFGRLRQVDLKVRSSRLAWST